MEYTKTGRRYECAANHRRTRCSNSCFAYPNAAVCVASGTHRRTQRLAQPKHVPRMLGREQPIHPAMHVIRLKKPIGRQFPAALAVPPAVRNEHGISIREQHPR
ncbi:MAG TPA: hypothetical protein VEU96_27505 [Bryobacteraceae bacterium]|nr:hypothetical protein [Bryobacteraceae bacterium]